MKAVVWTDTLQFGVLTAGYLAMIISALVKVGGPVAMWEKAKQGQRINFNKLVSFSLFFLFFRLPLPSFALNAQPETINCSSFNPSPFERSTFWTYLVGGFFRVFQSYISGQTYIQRYGTLPTARAASLCVIYLYLKYEP